MSQVRMRTAAQARFVKTFERITYKQSTWQAWTDFVTCAACSIANAVDRGPRWQQRETRYLDAIRKYDTDELNIIGELFAVVAEALEENPEQDFLGEIFQALELNSHWHGQFFTPYNICKMMAQMIIGDKAREEVEKKGYIGVNDPACGAGALLVAAANAYRAAGVNYQQHIEFVAQDIDMTAAMMCYIQISLLGCPGYVIVGDTLRHPPTEPIPEDYEVWYTPMWFSTVWHWRRIFRGLDKLLSGTQAEAEQFRERQDLPEPILKSGTRGSYFYFFFSEEARAE